MKKHPQKLLIIGHDPFFQYCQLAQIQPKSKFLFYKNLPPRDFFIMTLFVGILMTLFSDSFVLLRDCRGNCMDSTKKFDEWKAALG